LDVSRDFFLILGKTGGDDRNAVGDRHVYGAVVSIAAEELDLRLHKTFRCSVGEIEAGFWRGGAIEAGPDDEKENKQQRLTHRRSLSKLGKSFVMEMSFDPLCPPINFSAKMKLF
jgi:hypothetical protein